MTNRYTTIGLYLAALVALVDQGTKWWIVHEVMAAGKRTVPVTDFFNLVLSWNRGVTFGIMNREHPWMSYVFIAAAVVILFLLVHWLTRSSSLLLALGLGLVIGGAAGNVIDRLQYGAVVDFLDFHAYGHHWYAFNVADSAIVCGVGLLLLENWRERRR